MLDDILDGSLRSAAAEVASGRISARELSAAAVARITSSPSARACFLRMDAEDAASLGHDGLKAGAGGLLYGIPVAHKDLFSSPGRISSFAAHPAFHRRGTRLADALSALQQAGAVDLGALHLSEFAMGPAGWSEHYGFIDNPVSPGYVTGGSSSGSAAVVAHKAVFAALGTDTGGSIRIPAAFCGVVGLKPSNGLVSLTGVHPVSTTLDTVGSLARNVPDCARVLDALTRPGWTAGPAPYELAALSPSAAMRIGWIHPDSLPVPPDAVVLKAYEACAERLRQAGCLVQTVEVPDWTHLNSLTGLVFASEASAVHLDALRRRPAKIGAQVRERLQQGLAFPASLYVSALQQREKHRMRWRRTFFDHLDVLLCPVSPCPAPERSRYETCRDVGEILALNARVAAYTGIFNYLGVPALSLPVGREADGRTIGVQVVGDQFGEAKVFQAAGLLESVSSLGKRESWS
ncbi:amidase [Castellaniella hirudinis]|uniref:Amidase n=1 Tax=Castellaniella hirudinis TaxID=1144617 RepID=A0ABV8RW77_9BURK